MSGKDRQEITTASQEWILHLWAILNQGEERKPRGHLTKEVLANQTRIDMREPIVNVGERKMGYKFMCAEAAWILSGDNRVSSIKPYSKVIERFSDDGTYYHGAYGPKVVDQISYIVKTLLEDNDSRQALLNIWRENPGMTKDVPCTVSLQFLIRDGRLHCIDTMRSSDLWLGWVYDIFNMSMIARSIQIELRNRGLDVILGDLFLNAGSSHLYEQHFDKAEQIVKMSDKGEYISQTPLETIEVLHHSKFKDTDELVSYLWFCANEKYPLQAVYCPSAGR